MCNIKFPISNFELPKNALTKNLKFPNQDLQEFYLKVENDYIFADPFEEAVKIAKEIKRRMKLEVADYMTCSVGIGENKLLAKIASDLKKPDGIVVINSDQDALSNANCRALSDAAVLFKSDLYRKLQLTDIPGIGKRQEKNLNELGIKTLLDLKNYPQSKLVARFGPVGGHHLYSMGQLEGSWKARVSQEDEIKSMGHMYTLPKEFREKKFFVPVLYKLCEMVGKRMRDKNLMGDSLHFFLAGADHKGWGKSARLGYGIYDGRDIFAECMKMFESFHIRSGEFKLIGVTIFGLGQHVKQLSLFGNEEEHVRVLAALDKINQKYGDFSICRVPILSAGKVFRDSIGFGRLKEMPNMYGRGG